MGLFPSGAVAAAGYDDPAARFWDAGPGEPRGTFARGDGFACLGWCPDWRTAVGAGPDGAVRRWDVRTGRERRPLLGHRDRVNGVAVARDGRRVLSASNDWTVRLWDAQTARELRCLTGHGAEVWKVTFSPTQPLALSCSSDHTVRLWRLPA